MTFNSVPDLHAQREAALDTLGAWATAPNLRVLAISTTSLKGVPVAVAVVDAEGRVLLDTLVHTDQPMDPGAQAVHGLTPGDLRNAPSLAWLLDDLRAHLGEGNTVVAFTAPFVGEAFARACAHEDLPLPASAHWLSAQPVFGPVCGSYNHTRGQWSYVKLQDAVRETDMPTAHLAGPGTALGSAQRLALLLRWHGTAPRIGVSEDEPEEVGSCPDCGAPFDFCECPRADHMGEQQ